MNWLTQLPQLCQLLKVPQSTLSHPSVAHPLRVQQQVAPSHFSQKHTPAPSKFLCCDFPFSQHKKLHDGLRTISVGRRTNAEPEPIVPWPPGTQRVRAQAHSSGCLHTICRPLLNLSVDRQQVALLGLNSASIAQTGEHTVILTSPDCRRQIKEMTRSLHGVVILSTLEVASEYRLCFCGLER